MALEYKRIITLDNTGKSAKTDYPIPVTLAGITANYLSSGKLDAAADDLRFYDNSNNRLEHWILPGALGMTDALVFVKYDLPSDDSTTIKMLYKDASLSNVENGSLVFPFFDDFNVGGGASLNGTRWPTTVGTWSEQSGTPNYAYAATEGAYAIGNVGVNRSTGVRIIGRLQFSAIESTGRRFEFQWYPGTTIGIRAINDSGTRKAQIQSEAVVLDTDNYNFANNTYYTWIGLISGVNPYPITFYYNYVADPTLVTGPVNDNTDTGSGILAPVFTGAGTGRVDYCAMAPYDDPVVTVGAEAYAGPTIYSLDPTSAKENTEEEITVTGANFENGLSADLIKGAETIAFEDINFVDSTEFSGTVDLTGADLGLKNIRVTNP